MWLSKLVAQAVLGRLPGGEAINHQFQRIYARRRGPSVLLDRASDMARVIEVLERHHSMTGAVVVEVGTGWDALPTLCLSGAGAARIFTFDHRRHLRFALTRKAAAVAARRRPVLRDLPASQSLAALLRQARITYTAPGDASRTGLPDQSVDIFFSYAVLEHVPEKMARALIAEARRVLKPGGVFYALIGLHDHYHNFDRRVSKVNFLQYPEWLWAPLVKNPISYHNRLRERDFRAMLGGAEILTVNSEIDPADLREVETMKVDRRFRGYTPEELAVSRTEIVCRFLPERLGEDVPIDSDPCPDRQLRAGARLRHADAPTGPGIRAA